MNIGVLAPQPNIAINRPMRVSLKGNVYKIPVTHTDASGKAINNYEVWTTREAVQKHFDNSYGAPKEYQMRKFARQMYEKRLRASNGIPQEKGIFVTSDSATHGNPAMWPHTLVHPEIKI
jgi:hypothetical protein